MHAIAALGFPVWLRSIEPVERYEDIRGGQGGSREDNMYHEHVAGSDAAASTLVWAILAHRETPN